MSKETISIQIKKDLWNKGTEKGKKYSNQELLVALEELENELAQNLFHHNHAEKLSGRDVRATLEGLAKEHGLEENEVFVRLNQNLKSLGYHIATLKKGFAGERRTQNALKLLEMEDEATLLFNIQLGEKDWCAEYDAIVITPYGLYVIETKAWRGELLISLDGRLINQKNDCVYDLVGKMDMKKNILMQCLGERFPSRYMGVVAFPDASTEVKDYFERIPFVVGDGVSDYIKRHNNGDWILSKDEIAKIAEILISSQNEQKAFSRVDCEAIKEDYVAFMAMVEESSEELENLSYEQGSQECQEYIAKPHKNGWKTALKIGAGVLAAGGFLAAIFLPNTKSGTHR